MSTKQERLQALRYAIHYLSVCSTLRRPGKPGEVLEHIKKSRPETYALIQELQPSDFEDVRKEEIEWTVPPEELLKTWRL